MTVTLELEDKYQATEVIQALAAYQLGRIADQIRDQVWPQVPLFEAAESS